jgi:hypothetical protein
VQVTLPILITCAIEGNKDKLSPAYILELQEVRAPQKEKHPCSFI